MHKFVSFFGEHSPLFDELNKKAEEYAKTRNIEYVWVPQKPYDADEVVSQLNDADAAFIDVEPYDESIFAKMNDRCKLLVRFGVGYDKVNLPDATRHGLAIARTTGANKTGVAEMALLQMLAVGRQLTVNRKTVASGVWNKSIGSELIGKKVGILGFGNIGKALARLLAGFDCDILVYDNHPSAEVEAELGVRFTDLEEIITTCDAISVHLPYSEKTHRLFGAAEFDKMKPNAIIVCTARGKIVDEDALYDALTGGKIAGAGLDVFASEPLPADSKLIGLDNVVLTPHVSSQTKESLWNTYKKGVDVAADFFDGKTLPPSDLLNPDYANHPRA